MVTHEPLANSTDLIINDARRACAVGSRRNARVPLDVHVECLTSHRLIAKGRAFEDIIALKRIEIHVRRCFRCCGNIGKREVVPVWRGSTCSHRLEHRRPLAKLVQESLTWRVVLDRKVSAVSEACFAQPPRLARVGSVVGLAGRAVTTAAAAVAISEGLLLKRSVLARLRREQS